MTFLRNASTRLAGILLLFSSIAQARHPYTVDDMLRLEEIGKVRFDPAGQNLIFERYGPFEAQSSFARAFVRGQMRSRLYIAAVAMPQTPQLLFEQKADDGYTLNSISPDGAYLVFHHASANAFTEGVVALDSRRTREFGFSPDYADVIDIPWIADRLLAYSTLKAGDYPQAFALHTEQIGQLEDKWRASRDGKVTTASELGSGSYANYPGYGESLLIGDAADGTSRVLGPGKYAFEFASGDGQMLAALREDKLPLDPRIRIEHGANMLGIMRTLLIYDLSGRDRVLEPCAGCDVLESSLNWSPDGRYLAFVAREPGKTWETPQFWVFDRHTGRANRQALGTLKPHVGRLAATQLDIRSAWIGDRLALLLDRSGAGGSTLTAARDVRADWYVLDSGIQTNLTAEFTAGTPQFLGTASGALLLLENGKVWAVNVRGRRRELTASISEPVSQWREPGAFGVLPHFNVQPISTLVLQTKQAGVGHTKTVYFVDLSTRRVDRVTAPTAGAEAVAVSTATRRAAFLDTSSNATVLSVTGIDGLLREIATINEYLKDAVGGTPVRIDHKDSEGGVLHSWLLLPPGAKQGDRLATVVNVYPGGSCPETFSKWRLNEVHALNDQVLAAHGYAVLYPCVPVNYEQVPRDPMQGLADRVLAAVDAAAAEGYVDSDRLAIQGQSYGGYSTGAIVGLTHRFKSAVAQAGIYDLISAYGEFDQRLRLNAERVGPDLFAVSLSESSQDGMGAPPWQDPERYLRNSPLMHVDSITTPIMLINGDLDLINTTQSEEFFTALTRLNKDAKYVRYFGEDHVFNSPANIRDMWSRIFSWYEQTLGPPAKADLTGSTR